MDATCVCSVADVTVWHCFTWGQAHKKAILSAQMALFSPRVQLQQLEAARQLLSQAEFDDIVTERALAGLCGDPLCGQLLPTEAKQAGGQVPHLVE